MFTVCVADDAVDETTMLCEGLNQTGYNAIAVHDGEGALKACAAGDVDLLLLDVGLPDMDGYAVCARLKEDPKTREIPVIFVTAKGAAEDVDRGYELGAVDYISKPYNLPMVLVRVEAATRTRQLGDFLHVDLDSFGDTAYTDNLTGLRNRRYLMERMQEEVEKAHRYDFPVSCVVVDVDDIKAIDEELGAAALDDLLVEIAMTLRNYSRTYDIVCRFDGQLFAAVLPHTPLGDAVSYANKIQGEIGSVTFSDPSFPTRARLSFGIVTCRNGSARGADSLLGEAMQELLKAKSNPQNPIGARDL